MNQTTGVVLRDDHSITTDRLLLTPFHHVNQAELLAIFQHPDVRRFLLDDTLVDAAWLAERTETYRAYMDQLGYGLWAASLKTHPDKLMGFGGLMMVGDKPPFELLWALLPEHWGQGLATEMGAAFIHLAFTRWGFDEVLASTDIPNKASVRVMQQLGMQFHSQVDEPQEGQVFGQIHYVKRRQK